MGAIKAILFDLDGVLVDSSRWHFPALSRALSEHGYELSASEHALRYDGLPTKEKLKLLTAEKGLPAALHAEINEKKQRYTLELIALNCRPRAAHLHMLAQLKAEGYRLAVVSNSTRASMAAVLACGGILPHLDLHLSSQDVSSPKPDPEIYLAACSRLRTPPAECLALEDRAAGFEAARAAGTRAIMVAGIEEVCYTFVKSHIDGAADEKI